MDSDEADEENKAENGGKTLLYVFERGLDPFSNAQWRIRSRNRVVNLMPADTCTTSKGCKHLNSEREQILSAQIVSCLKPNLIMLVSTQLTGLNFCRDSIGDSAITGDVRWSGAYGVNVDYIARSHCSVEVIKIEDIQVQSVDARGA